MLKTHRASSEPTLYRIRLAGHLDDDWEDWFGELSMARLADGTTVLAVPAADQAALHGVLARIRDLGIALVSVEMTEPPGPGTPEDPGCGSPGSRR